MKLFLIIFVLTNASLILAQEYDWQNNHIRIGERVMLTEEWKPLTGYKTSYEVSNYGKIRSLPCVFMRNDGKKMTVRGRMRKLSSLDSCGYPSISLKQKNGERKIARVHTLVWDAFGDMPRNGRKLMVDHIDNDKTNNRIDNLQLLNNRANCSKGKTRRQLLPTGVHKRNNKYVAIIMIGAYDNPQEASINYQRVVAHLDDLSLKSGS